MNEEELKEKFDLIADDIKAANSRLSMATKVVNSMPLRTLSFMPTEKDLIRGITESFMQWGPNQGRDVPGEIEIAFSSRGLTSKFTTVKALAREIVFRLEATAREVSNQI